MDFEDLCQIVDTVVDLPVHSKSALLHDLAHRAALVLKVDDDTVFSALLKREELGSTGMGGGVAIPHARFHHLHKPFGMLVRLKKPIEFDAVDGNPVDTIALLLLPDVRAGERLGALACFARKLCDPAVMTALRRARDGAEIYRSLTAD